jgi:TonB family protein
VNIAEFSASWEGRTIDAFPLRQFLGAAENSAVFLTDYESGSAAIKLLSLEAEREEEQLSRWRTAAALSHPNLVRIFTMGRCELDGISLLYVVMDSAEENLYQVLPDRSLTAAETREMLEPTLSALDYIHKHGLVHAHLKPANVMAVNECLKISSDGIRPPGSDPDVPAGPYDPPERASGTISPAGDVWALGMTLSEILTQRLPADGKVPLDLPEPYAQIARGCLERNPAERWTISRIAQHLAQHGGATPAPRKKRSFAPIGVIILLTLLVITVVGVMLRRGDNEPKPVAPSAAVPTTVAQAPEPAPAPPPEPKKESKKTVAKAPEPEQQPPAVPEAKQPETKQPAAAPANDTPSAGILSQPMPDIIDQARNTIRGRVRVTVRVEVDPSGSVTDAKLETAGGTNKYFGDRALAAARQWKFEPITSNGSQVGQRWRLRFEFYKTNTKVIPQRVSP